MQGTEKPDRELLDVLGLCGGLVRVGSVYRFLAENRLRLFPDGLFADLFGGRGRPSVPGSVVATVLVLQALEGCSDREAVERLRCDLRWKAAAGLSVDDAGFHYSVLSLWRHRLRVSGRPQRVFDAVRDLAGSCGALAGSRRRALDSTVLYDAVATQDTYTMIAAQIRRCRRLIAETAGLELMLDYGLGAKPSCDWSDPGERAWLIDELVTDACAVLAETAGLELTDEQADAAALLAAVAGQDVEADPRVPGRRRIARRTAAGRVISTVDPESRHAHKTRSVRRDGYKAHIVAEPDTGIITAAELTAADASDARVGARLLNTDPTHHTGSGHTGSGHDDGDHDHTGSGHTGSGHDDGDHDHTGSDHTGSGHDDGDHDHTGSGHTGSGHTGSGHDDGDHDHTGSGHTGSGHTGSGHDTTDTDDTDTTDTTDTDTDTGDTDTTDTDDTDTDTGDTDTTDTTDTDTDDTGDTDTGDDGGWLVLADSAYASGEALESFTDAGWDTAIKPIERRPPIAGGFTREDFGIDTDAQTVTCPAGHTRPVTSGAARFGRLCDGCPLRARCTTSPRGRSVAVDAHEAHRRANKARWRQPPTQAAYRRHRPMVERSIAWLARGKARRVPYRGVAANHLWLTNRAAAVNLVRLANLGVAHNGTGFALPAAG